MPTVRHPRALEGVTGHLPAAVTVSGASFDVEGETVALPTERHVEELAQAYGLTAADLRVTETCETVKSDGEVCGREVPCPYHSD